VFVAVKDNEPSLIFASKAYPKGSTVDLGS